MEMYGHGFCSWVLNSFQRFLSFGRLSCRTQIESSCGGEDWDEEI